MPQGKRTYAVTGATGQIGKRVAERLREQGNEVRVIGRSAAGQNGLTSEIIRLARRY